MGGGRTGAGRGAPPRTLRPSTYPTTAAYSVAGPSASEPRGHVAANPLSIPYPPAPATTTGAGPVRVRVPEQAGGWTTEQTRLGGCLSRCVPSSQAQRGGTYACPSGTTLVRGGLSRKDAPVRLQERAGRHAHPPAALAFGHSTLGTTCLTKLCRPLGASRRFELRLIGFPQLLRRLDAAVVRRCSDACNIRPRGRTTPHRAERVRA